MRALLPIIMISPLALILFHAACGSERPADYRSKQANTLEAVAEKPNPVLINFSLPDRSKDPTLAGVSAYYFKLLGEGSDCPAGELIEEVGTWDDGNREIKFKVNGKCNYSVTIRLGEYQAPQLALASKLSFEGDIRPILESQCISCHETYADYSEVVTNGEMILKEIEAKTMPKVGPLSDVDIAKFLAWKDAGYAEKAEVVLPSEKEKQISSIFYQNNKNDYLMAYELLSRSIFELRRSLWIQPDGVAAGMTVKELSTYSAQ